MTGNTRLGIKRYRLAFVATVCLFATWGLVNHASGVVSPQLVAFFDFDPLQSALAQTSFGLSYFLFAVPAALFLRRFGYKLGLVLGLSTLSFGALMLYPAFSQHLPPFFLATVIITGTGWAFLETCANPLIVQMGPPETAVRRLNIVQCFYPVGLLAAAYFGRSITLPDAHVTDAHFAEAVVRPYIVVGLVVLLMAFLIENVEFPPVAVERAAKKTRVRDEFRSLLAQPMFRFALAAMAACMMALVCLWGVAGEYFRLAVPELFKSTLDDVSLYLWIACGIGRFAGTGLMFRFDPARLLVLFSGACLGMAALAGVTISMSGFAFLIGASFFISIIFPTIFAGAIRDLGTLTKSASGLVVTAAGLGGIVGTIVMRVVMLFPAVRFALVVASLCLAVVLAYAVSAQRSGKAAEDAAEGRAVEA